jgi:alkaline phosphatase
MRPISAVVIYLLGSAVAAFSAPPGGSAIFVHPDGAGANAWGVCRAATVGPDGQLAWDRIPRIGLYRGHMKDGLAATSHGGATTHAYGVKVVADSYGLDGTARVKSASGYDGSIMHEAKAAGKAVGIVNSGHICEPGTGAFLARVEKRGDVDAIAAQVVGSGAEVIFCGGEKYLLPAGAKGFHGPGARKDGRDLIAEAKGAGYAVVYDRAGLLALGTSAARVLGVFAREHTFNDLSEEALAAAKLPLYAPGAPTVGEMTRAALEILGRDPDGFLLVVEEEGSDNFGNANNARGVIEALTRADGAYAVALEHLGRSPQTLLLTACDSDAGGLQAVCHPESMGNAFAAGKSVPPRDINGAALHGKGGMASAPFVSAADREGRTFAYGLAFATSSDVPGAILARAAGRYSEELPADCDNTAIYRMLYRALFGKAPGR